VTEYTLCCDWYILHSMDNDNKLLYGHVPDPLEWGLATQDQQIEWAGLMSTYYVRIS